MTSKLLDAAVYGFGWLLGTIIIAMATGCSRSITYDTYDMPYSFQPPGMRVRVVNVNIEDGNGSSVRVRLFANCEVPGYDINGPAFEGRFALTVRVARDRTARQRWATLTVNGERAYKPSEDFAWKSDRYFDVEGLSGLDHIAVSSEIFPKRVVQWTVTGFDFEGNDIFTMAEEVDLFRGHASTKHQIRYDIRRQDNGEWRVEQVDESQSYYPGH